VLLCAFAQVADARSALEPQPAVIFAHQLQQPLHDSRQAMLLLFCCCWRLRQRCCCLLDLLRGCWLLLCCVLEQLLACFAAVLRDCCQALHRRFLQDNKVK
jgi:hypothetical protein